MGRRGRRPGTKNGEGEIKLAPIKNWKPWMTKIIVMHMAGMSAEEISKQFPSKHDASKFMTRGRISQIINDPQGQQMIRGMNERVKEGMLKDINDGMLTLAHKSVNRLAETLNEDFTPGSNAKKHQDMVSLTIVKNYIPGEAENKLPEGEGLTDKGLGILAQALNNAAKAKMIHSGQNIADAEYEILDKKEKVS